ncbi:hypothetical protein [Halomarina pelagica]|uniref:hypothetical protein n=1 Tax=Halomarina pelagica TaxID=2961599 RepID=UPI0020C25EA2|nr:hypothetical protein [Halomarina sp. BND7]
MPFDSGVTPEEVRRAIGLEPTGSDALDDVTAVMFIADAEATVAVRAAPTAADDLKAAAVRAVAASRAFASVDEAWVAEQSEMDVSERSDVRDRAQALRDAAEEALADVSRRSPGYVRRVNPGG